MVKNLDLTQKEKMLIDDNRKSILIRPKGAEVSKGSMLRERELDMIVVNVRYYPTIKDLFKIERLENVATKTKDTVDAIAEFEKKYEGFNCDGFCAVEVALQD